jgi:Ca-activated chloride channel homolog
MKTTILLDHEPVADGGWVVRALLRMEGEAVSQEGRTPLNLSLVLDRSGSMEGEPIEAAREAARALVRQLSPEDTVSVVAFGSEVETIAPPASGDAQQDLVARIDAIDIEGCTNLSGGWLKGRDHVARGFREAAVNRVLLLTDGVANEGITDHASLRELCRTASARGVTTTTIGFGTGFNEELLRDMADAGGGSTYYIERPDQAPGIFAEELEGLLSMSAQNATVRIEPAVAAEDATVLHSYPSHTDGRALVVEIGDVYAREPRLLLCQFLIRPDDTGGEVAVAELVVTAHVLTGDGGVELRTTRLPITVSTADGARAEPDVRREIILLEAANARRLALEDQMTGDFDGASSRLRTVAGMLRDLGGDDYELNEEIADLDAMTSSLELRMCSEADVKYMKQRVNDSSRSKRLGTKRISRTRPADNG